jgi:hypothetical protein
VDRTAAIPIDRYGDIPKKPGVYMVFSDTTFDALPWDPMSGPAYVGKAEDGLRRRLKKEHGGDTGRSTLRRSLGCLLINELDLRPRPRPSKKAPKPVNYANFTFGPGGENRLTEWMSRHLTVVAQPLTGGELAVDALIQDLNPPLNLRGWQNSFADVILAARRRCADEARRYR